MVLFEMGDNDDPYSVVMRDYMLAEDLVLPQPADRTTLSVLQMVVSILVKETMEWLITLTKRDPRDPRQWIGARGATRIDVCLSDSGNELWLGIKDKDSDTSLARACIWMICSDNVLSLQVLHLDREMPSASALSDPLSWWSQMVGVASKYNFGFKTCGVIPSLHVVPESPVFLWRIIGDRLVRGEGVASSACTAKDVPARPAHFNPEIPNQSWFFQRIYFDGRFTPRRQDIMAAVMNCHLLLRHLGTIRPEALLLRDVRVPSKDTASIVLLRERDGSSEAGVVYVDGVVQGPSPLIPATEALMPWLRGRSISVALFGTSDLDGMLDVYWRAVASGRDTVNRTKLLARYVTSQLS